MTKHAFSFLRGRVLPPKPRTTCIFVGTDLGLTLGQQEDLLESYCDIIDYAKFSDHAGLISRWSDAWFKKKLDIYRHHSIGTFIGGTSFEIAVLHGKVDDYFKKMKELGFTGVEVSYDCIPDVWPPERAAMVSQAKNLGFEVFTEVGRKFSDKPLKTSHAIQGIKADLASGSRRVTIEAAEVTALKDTNPQVLTDVIKAVGLDKVVFECAPPDPWIDTARWLIKTFGTGVNLQNIPVQDCNYVYRMRQGLERSMGYPLLAEIGNKI